MLTKAVAGWLTNTTEKGYQAAFVSYLLHRGDTVLYNSQHRPLEQGKDVASRTADGRVQAFQLKGVKIDLTMWRSIYGEIVDLVSMPVRHPSVDLSKAHEAFRGCAPFLGQR